MVVLCHFAEGAILDPKTNPEFLLYPIRGPEQWKNEKEI
jgi:hypothetical protein